MDIDKMAYKHLTRSPRSSTTPVYDQMVLIFGEVKAHGAIHAMAETLTMSALVIAQPASWCRKSKHISYKHPRNFVVVPSEEERKDFERHSHRKAEQDGVKFSTARPNQRPDNGWRHENGHRPISF